MKTSGVLDLSSSSLDLIDDHHESRPSSRTSSYIGTPSKHGQRCDLWLSSDGEFKQHYDSIMYSTNLVDSCVEALNDITMDEGSVLRAQEESILVDERRLSDSDRRTQSTGGRNSNLSDEQVMAFEQWLTAMEARVANYPTLTDIYAMEANEMRRQFDIHSKTFNDIVAQTCIVGNSMHNNHRALAERYHLLYLRAYEVLLLLEGLPFDQGRNDRFDDDEHVDANTDDGIGGAGGDNNNGYYDAVVEEEDGVTRLNDTHDDNDYLFGDVNVFQCSPKAFVCHRKSRSGRQNEPLSPVLESIEHARRDSGNDERSSSGGSSSEDKTAMPYDNDLVSLFENMDELYETLRYDDRDCGMQTSPEVLRSAPSIDYGSPFNDYQRHNNVNNMTKHSYFDHMDISVYEENTTVTTTTVTTDIGHNKVYNWLNSRTINVNAFDESDVRSDFVYIYKAKSESNMDAAALSDRRLSSASSSTLSSASLASKAASDAVLDARHDNATQANESVVSDVMDWDHFQPDLLLCHQQPFHLDDWDAYSMTASEWHLCFFGENYEYYVETSDSAFSDQASFVFDDDISMNHQFESTKTVSEMDAMASTATLHTDSERVLKRRRRRNNRRVKKMRDQQTIVPAIATADASSMSSAYSEPSISAIASDMCSSMSNTTASMQSLPSASSRPPTPSTDATKSIRYNSDDQSFEVFGDAHADTAPIKHKVNELKPEDFHDIIKMCRSNIDCVITVLGAEPNRVLTVDYCQKMRWQRAATAATTTATAASATKQHPIHDESHCCNERKLMLMAIADAHTGRGTLAKNGACCGRCTDIQYTCLCSWVAQTIAMIINFLLDCWNIFRNMRLYTYLGKVLRGFFAATREVAKRINSQKELGNALTHTAMAC